nr:hypothetical protein [Tanacetum cinerariifolium]
MPLIRRMEQGEWGYAGSRIDHYTYSCDEMALIRHIFFAGYSVDVVPLIPKLPKNKTAHIDYLKHTLEEATTLRELVESERLLSPLNTPLAYACKYTRRIQELLMILQQTCPRITDLGTTLVAVTPKNQNKQ